MEPRPFPTQQAANVQSDTDPAAFADMGNYTGLSFYGAPPPIQPQEEEGEETAPETIQAKCSECEAESPEPTVQRREEEEDGSDESVPVQSMAEEGEAVSEDETTLQAKLSVGKPGDKYEQEADNMAAQVMAMGDPSVPQEEMDGETVQAKPLAGEVTPLVQRRQIQRKRNKDASPSIERQLRDSGGGGRPLADGTRSFMESRFGADFSGVRVHTDSAAVQMTKSLGAQAFTHGQDIYYGKGKSPGKNDLTAHELTHTIQQTGGLKRNKEVIRKKTEQDKQQLQTKQIAATTPEISLNKEIPLVPKTEEDENETLQPKQFTDRTRRISLFKEIASTSKSEWQEKEPTVQAKDLTDEAPEQFLNKDNTYTLNFDENEEDPTLQAKQINAKNLGISLNKELQSPSKEEETPLIQAKELPGKTVVNKFTKGDTETGNFTSSPVSIQRGLLSGVKGLAERGLGWIRSRVLAPMRSLAARGWSGVQRFGGKISTAYQQANPQIWDIFQPEHLMFRMARNQRTQLFAQAIQAEQGQRAIATASSQSGEIAPVNEPSQLQRLDGIAQTIESAGETFFNIRKELIEGAVVGDFKENPTIWNTIGQIGMGFVPFAGQAADIRDLVASVQKLHKSGYKDPWEWFNLALVGIGFIPGIGDAIKAGGRAAKGVIRRSLKSVLTKADNLLRPVLGRAKGMLQGATRQGRRFMQWASGQGTTLRQGVRQLGQKSVNFARKAGKRARGLVNRLKRKVKGLLGSAKQIASSFLTRGRGLLGQAVGKFLSTAKGVFNQAKNRVSQAMSQVKAAMQRGKAIAQGVLSKVARARQRATSLMKNFTQSAIQRGRSLLQSGRRFASQLRSNAARVGRNLVKGARKRVEGLIRNGVKFAKERAIPFIKQKLGGVKHRVKKFLQDKWNQLKEKLGIKEPIKVDNTQSIKPPQRSQTELDDLARDPAHGNNIEPKGVEERTIGLSLEARGDLKPPIKRDPSGAAEFIDGDGVKWDIKGFNSHYPPRKGGFSLDRDIGKIEAELDKGENVILDTTQLNQTHIEQLRAEIQARGWTSKIRWYP